MSVNREDVTRSLYDDDRPIRDMSDADLRDVHMLALDRVNVLEAVCRSMGARLEKCPGCFANDVERWVVTPATSPSFRGTYAEAMTFVHGYAVAWADGRLRMQIALDSAVESINALRPGKP